MKEKKKRTLTLGETLMYAMGIFGIQLFIGYVNSYQSQFYTSMYGDAVSLMAVAVIILVSKLVSAIADPFIGNLIDGSNFKSGKMKPFIFISAFPLAVLTTIMFIKIPFSSKGLMYAYITVTTVLWNVAMSFADIPSQGLLAALSPIASERDSAANLANITRSTALGVPGVLVPLVCVFTGNERIGEKEYLIAAGAILVVGFSLHLMLALGSKERVVAINREKQSIRQMVGELKSNKMIFILFLTYMLGFARNIQMGIGVQSAAVLLKDGVSVDLGFFTYSASGENLAWLIGATSAFSSCIGIFTISLINKKWGEKKTFIAFAVYGLVMSVAAYLCYLFGGAALRSVWAILIYQFLCGFMYSPHGYLPLIITGDIVDYQEWKTGRRTEGTQFAIMSMSNKISNALSVAVGIFIVGASGYVGTMAAQDISDKMQDVVAFAYLGMPGLASMLAAIPMFWYKIDGKVKETMRAELALRRAKIK